MNLISIEEALPLTPHGYYALLALAYHPMSAYDLFDQCQADSSRSFSFNRRNLYRTVKSLERWGYVKLKGEYVSAGSPFYRKVYQITSTGELVLSWEADRYREASVLARGRLASLANRAKAVTLPI